MVKDFTLKGKRDVWGVVRLQLSVGSQNSHYNSKGNKDVLGFQLAYKTLKGKGDVLLMHLLQTERGVATGV